MMNPAVVRRDLLLLRNAPSMRPPAHNINSNAARVLCAQACRAMGLVLLIIILLMSSASLHVYAADYNYNPMSGPPPAIDHKDIDMDINAALESDTLVYLVTVLPGKHTDEFEGQSAIRIITPSGDTAYTWGTFGSNAPHYIYQYLEGKTTYTAVSMPWSTFLSSYVSRSRGVLLQGLVLDPVQIHRLMDILEENLHPENRDSRYDYFLDNCATRSLSAIENALGFELRLPDEYLGKFNPEKTTYRQALRSYHAGYPWYQFGLELALGSEIDQPLGNGGERKLTFTPLLLAGFIGNCVIDYAKAHGVPVVLGTVFLDGGMSKTSEKGANAIINSILEGDCDKITQTASSPTPWYLSPLVASLVLLVISFFVARKVKRELRPIRGFYTAFYGVIAIVGTILTYLVFSDHYATSPNWLLLWLNPFAIIPAILIWNKRMELIADVFFLVRLFPTLILILIWPWISQRTDIAIWPWFISDLLLTFARMERAEELTETPEDDSNKGEDSECREEKIKGIKRTNKLWGFKTNGYTYIIENSNSKESRESSSKINEA